MEHHKDNHKRGITRYTKESERAFFFYATLAMFIIYVCFRLFGE
jgi:hypothetical protein